MNAWSPDIITAFSVVLVALTGLITALTAMWQAVKKQATQVNAAIADNTKTTNATHTLVNNLHDEQTMRTDRAEGSLRAHGIAVPVDPAVPAAIRRVREADEPPIG